MQSALRVVCLDAMRKAEANVTQNAIAPTCLTLTPPSATVRILRIVLSQHCTSARSVHYCVMLCKARLSDSMSSVCLSVRPSVTFRYRDGIKVKVKVKLV